MATLISALAWVKRGVAAENPTKYDIDENELARVSQLAREELEDAQVNLEEVGKLVEEMGVGADEEDHEEDWEEYILTLY
jgi:periodic tryptophan protein 1